MSREWIGTSLKLDVENSCFIDRLKQESINLRENDDEVTLETSKIILYMRMNLLHSLQTYYQ